MCILDLGCSQTTYSLALYRNILDPYFLLVQDAPVASTNIDYIINNRNTELEEINAVAPSRKTRGRHKPVCSKYVRRTRSLRSAGNSPVPEQRR